jgi:stress-induced morphogen
MTIQVQTYTGKELVQQHQTVASLRGIQTRLHRYDQDR